MPCFLGEPPGLGASVGVVCWAVDVVGVLFVAEAGAEGVVGVATSWHPTTTAPAGTLGSAEVSHGAPSGSW